MGLHSLMSVLLLKNVNIWTYPSYLSFQCFYEKLTLLQKENKAWWGHLASFLSWNIQIDTLWKFLKSSWWGKRKYMLTVKDLVRGLKNLSCKEHQNSPFLHCILLPSHQQWHNHQTFYHQSCFEELPILFIYILSFEVN